MIAGSPEAAIAYGIITMISFDLENSIYSHDQIFDTFVQGLELIIGQAAGNWSIVTDWLINTWADFVREHENNVGGGHI